MGPAISEKPGTIVVETNRFDVVLGRGKNANNRPGNVSFRRLTLNLAAKYQECVSPEEKNQMAGGIISEIQSNGGRFMRSVTAANAKGQQIGAWEVVSTEVAVAKVKQAMRDITAVAKKRARIQSKREEEKSLPSWQFNYPSAVGMQQQLEMTHQRNRLVEMIRFQQQNRFQPEEIASPSRMTEWCQQQQATSMTHQPPPAVSAGQPVTVNASQQPHLLLMLQQTHQQEQLRREQYLWGRMNSSVQPHRPDPPQYHGLAAPLHSYPHLQHMGQPDVGAQLGLPQRYHTEGKQHDAENKDTEPSSSHAVNDRDTKRYDADSAPHSAKQPPRLDSTGSVRSLDGGEDASTRSGKSTRTPSTCSR